MTRNEETIELIYKDESYAIIGACFEVYKDKGCGFHEPIYHECLEIELEFQRISFLSKPPQTLQYRGRTLIQKSEWALTEGNEDNEDFSSKLQSLFSSLPSVRNAFWDALE